MDDLHHALGEINSIRRQMARTTQFRGCGPATLAGTGLAAIVAASAQNVWIHDPGSHITAYLGLWIGTAVLSSSFAGLQIHTRTRRMHSGLSNEMLHAAVEQFMPAVAAGLLLTVVLARYVPGALWMLPGLWQLVYGLGVFASCRSLPRPMMAAGAWYLLSGLACISLGDDRALAPWTMGLAFGAGQLIAAGILFAWTPKEADEA